MGDDVEEEEDEDDNENKKVMMYSFGLSRDNLMKASSGAIDAGMEVNASSL